MIDLDARSALELEHLLNGPLTPAERRQVEEELNRRHRDTGANSKDQLSLWPQSAIANRKSAIPQ